ncbi:MAG: penicillin-binding transpeptidase domain-containing protein, partial [Bacteroidales bacterium]
MGDYVGISGIEKAYEQELRGVKGKRVVLVDVYNREKGSYNNGEEDVRPVSGTSLWSTLDLTLQRYGEMLMSNKRGSIVAIEPATGEILCIVSSPSYDPNLLVGKARSKNYVMLMHDSIRKPLFNRALMAMYPPGSTFKLANGLIAQEEGVLAASSVYYCPGGYRVGSHTIGCHHSGPANLASAVQFSCNFYFCKAFYSIISNKQKYPTIQEGYQAWRNHIMALGFGQKFDTDLPYELKGIIPTPEYFDKKYNNRWNGNSVVSIGIGQGEVGTTPLQMANLLAIIANRGYYVKPHVIKAIGSKNNPNTRFNEKIDAQISPQYFEAVIQGMEMAVLAGTARAAQISGIKVAGKTGTAQNPHGKDHSVFALIAPIENPKIVVFCLVENAGWGGTVAAPIASLIAELYLTGKISRPNVEENIKSMSLR